MFVSRWKCLDSSVMLANVTNGMYSALVNLPSVRGFQLEPSINPGIIGRRRFSMEIGLCSDSIRWRNGSALPRLISVLVYRIVSAMGKESSIHQKL